MSSKRGVTSEDLYSFQWIQNPVVSPADGRIVYLSRRVNDQRTGYHTHLRMMNADGSQDIAFTSGEGDHAPAWSPDGQQLAFLRKKDQHTQVWLIPAYGGEAIPVTELKYGVQSFKWSPDGSRLLLTSEQEPERPASEQNADGSRTDEQDSANTKEQKQPRAKVIDRITYKSDGGGLWEGRRNHLYLHPLNGSGGRWLTSGEYDVRSFTWSPDGQQIAFITRMPAEEEADPDLVLTTDLYTLALDKGSTRRWTSDNYDIYDLAWSPEGTRIAFVASDESYHNATLSRLYELSLEDGQVRCMCRDSDLLVGNMMVGDTGIGSTGEPVYSADGSLIYALITARGTVQLAAFDRETAGHRILRGGQRNIHYFAPVDRDNIIFVAADPLQPGELFHWDAEVDAETRLTHANDSLLAGLVLSKPEEFEVMSVDGKPLQAWIMKPVGELAAGSRAPAVLEIHGGPHMMYGYTFMHEFQLLASQGYAVIFTNPRGSHGYGQQFVNACRGDYGGGDYRDLMEVVDYVLEHYEWVDGDRLGVTGGSYGGFMTNWIVGQTDRFKAAVTQRSISSWISFYGVSDIGFYFTEDQIGGNPWQQLETLWKHSPLAYVENVKTPILILHGEQDLRCPIEQAEQWFTGLKRLGAVTRLVRFPGANHNLSRGGHPQLRIQRLDHIAGWFEQYL